MRNPFHLRLLLALAAAVPVFAADTPPPAPPAAPPPGTADTPPLREQTIYIPYENLRKVFEKTGRGVFLPYEEFQKLWQAARQGEARPPEVKPPVDNLVAEIAGTATVAKDVIEVAAKLRIDLLKPGWNQVALRLGDVAITRATIGQAPARLLATPDGYVLLVENPAKEPMTLDLELAFAKAFDKAPGRNSVSFQAPSTPVSTWDIRIPEPGVKVNVQPLLAATEAPTAPDVAETRVLAFVGAAPAVRIEWTPKAEGAKGLTALASAQAETRVSIDEGVTRTRVVLNYTVSRAELSQFLVEAPADQKIVNVFDPNLREWSVAAAGAVQRITAQLFEPARERQSLVIELERFAAEADVAVPMVRALDVSRQQGVVAVKVAAGLRAEPLRRENLLQLDAAELPAGLAGEPWDFAYRYAALPFDLALRVEKILPRILAETLVEAHVHPEQAYLDVLAVFDVQRAGVFQLFFALPTDWDVRYVRGERLEGVTPAEVDSHHRVDDQPGRLAVNLSRQALGRVAVALQLYRRLSEADLLTPTGKAAVIPLPIPRADPDSVFRESGRVVVYGPDSLRFNPRDSQGLRTISHAEAVQGLRSTQNASAERPVIAFAFGDEPATLTVEAERRKPHITVRQLLTTRIESGVAKFEATFFCDVLYSSVKSLRLDLPAALAEQVRIPAGGIRHAPIENTAELTDLLPDHVAWRLSGETEFLGTVTLPMVWEQKIDKLDVGASVALAIPRIVPRGADRAWGQIVLAKAESIDVVPDEPRTGLRAIDPQHDLMPGANVRDAARAFEFHDDWALTVKATRYEAKDVKATSIERAVVTAVATRGDLTSVQAVYRMRSARQRLTVQLPGQVEFDTQPLHINGRPVALEQGAEQEYFIPLTGQNPNEPFLVEMRYTVRGAGRRFECPAFPQEPATQQVYLSVFLPEELSYLGSRGPWNDEMVWAVRGFSSWPRANQPQTSLYAWVTQGLPVPPDSLASFATDGRHLLFSTLRPPAGRAGALRVSALRDLLFQALVILVGVGIGLWLVPARFARRALVIGVAAVVLLLLAVFLPSLARAMVSNAAVVAAMIVLIIWVLWYLLVTRPRDPAVQARRLAREEARRRAAEAAPPPPAGPPSLPPAAPPPPVAEPSPEPK